MASKSTDKPRTREVRKVGRFTIIDDYEEPKILDRDDDSGISVSLLHDDIDDDQEIESWLEEARQQQEQQDEEKEQLQRNQAEKEAEEDFKNVPWEHMLTYKWKKDSVNLLKQKMKDAKPGHKAVLRVYLKTPNLENKRMFPRRTDYLPTLCSTVTAVCSPPLTL